VRLDLAAPRLHHRHRQAPGYEGGEGMNRRDARDVGQEGVANEGTGHGGRAHQHHPGPARRAVRPRPLAPCQHDRTEQHCTQRCHHVDEDQRMLFEQAKQ
jgi:hypothetical protein